MAPSYRRHTGYRNGCCWVGICSTAEYHNVKMELSIERKYLRYVNPNHHTSCFAGSEGPDLTFDPPRPPADPYTIPESTHGILKLKSVRVPEDSILNLCRTARVYFNSDRASIFRRKLQRRFDEVSSPRKVNNSKTSLIPLEGFESKVKRRKQGFSGNEENYESTLPAINNKRRRSNGGTFWNKKHDKSQQRKVSSNDRDKSRLTRETTKIQFPERRGYDSDDDYSDDD